MAQVSTYWSSLPLGVLAARGADARRFLQGQLSADVLGLDATRLRWAGLHNPQGRALGLLRLVADAADVLALVPADMVQPLLGTLRRYVLRAKVTLADESANWRVHGAQASLAEARTAWPSARVVEWSPDTTRCVILERIDPGAATDDGSGGPSGAAAAPAASWHRLDVAAGLPQVYPATSGEFVAQMLNLDVVGGIAFDKGCYTGQEIIARAHYRGRMKRRMQRFAAPHARAADWPPGQRGRLPDGRHFEIVDSADVDSAGCELLAVTHVGEASAETAERTDVALPVCADAAPLGLPYALP